ncbi:MAG: UDP-N-acetylglucosamine diphosphorylase/glucosamine-1-phosphate N-acetyltransferase [Bacteroidia bacterium]|jgi:UDP-N-acetylglucosamine diphosphorylase/glucosamine-1-phosphate N-acetyltransferase
MNIVLFDDDLRDHLLPLTFTRPVADLRIGIMTIAEKWSKRLAVNVSYKTVDYLQHKFSATEETSNVYINGACLPSDSLVQEIESLSTGESLVTKDNRLVAKHTATYLEGAINKKVIDAQFVNYPEDIFTLNAVELEKDYDLITEGRTSLAISASNTVVGKGRIFLETGAIVEGAVLNASNGSIYIGHNAEVMEGAMIRGGLAMCESSALKMGAKIYGATTIGPFSKAGGEVNNSVIMGYSNKGHDGFLGNSVLGEWCNLGADTNNSNLKNNYAEVKLWSYVDGRFRKTGTQFCGLVMGDHSKCGINTMFNTGTVIGVCANIFGSGFPRNYVPSFAWGGSAGYSTYQLNKANETAQLVMQRRGKSLDEVERAILENVFNKTQINRIWEV